MFLLLVSIPLMVIAVALAVLPLALTLARQLRADRAGVTPLRTIPAPVAAHRADHDRVLVSA